MLIDLIKYIIFGFIQGLTEPLPISSSGHLIVLRYIFNTNTFDDLSFEILLNFASLLAIFFIFRCDIIKLIKSFFTYIIKKDKRQDETIKEDFKYSWLIILGSVPAAIFGLAFKDFIESKLSSINVLGFSFLITAILLFLVRKLNGIKKDKDITKLDAILIGLFEAFALIPGISRSGAVLVGCLLRGLDRNTSIKYSFMLYFPVSIGAFLLSLDDLMNLDTTMFMPYLVGFLVSAITTYFASRWFFNIVKKGRLAKFSIYLIILALIIFIFL